MACLGLQEPRRVVEPQFVAGDQPASCSEAPSPPPSISPAPFPTTQQTGTNGSFLLSQRRKSLQSSYRGPQKGGFGGLGKLRNLRGGNLAFCSSMEGAARHSSRQRAAPLLLQPLEDHCSSCAFVGHSAGDKTVRRACVAREVRQGRIAGKMAWARGRRWVLQWGETRRWGCSQGQRVSA